MMDNQKVAIMLTVGVVSTVIAWGVTRYMDAWLDRKRGHIESRGRLGDGFAAVGGLRNRIISLKGGAL